MNNDPKAIQNKGVEVDKLERVVGLIERIAAVHKEIIMLVLVIVLSVVVVQDLLLWSGNG